MDNLCLSCQPSHFKKRIPEISEFLTGLPEKLKKMTTPAQIPLKDAAVNSTQGQLFETLRTQGLPVRIGAAGGVSNDRAL